MVRVVPKKITDVPMMTTRFTCCTHHSPITASGTSFSKAYMFQWKKGI